MGEPRITLSVIIPCFNYEAYVGEAIESVLRQVTPDIEIIVVDDGSSDRSWDVIQKYSGKIRSVRTENRGSVSACMTGLKLSSGAFIYFLDADDMLCPGAIAVVRPHLQPEISKIQFMLMPIDKAGSVIGEPFPKLDPAADSRRLIEFIAQRGSYATPPTSGNVYRRDIYEEAGDLSFEPSAIDGVPYLLAPFMGEVVSIDKPLGRYRIHGSNVSSFTTMTSERIEYCIERFLNRLKHLEALLAAKKIRRDFELRTNYAYVGEMKLMGSVARGERPPATLLMPYLRSLMLEQTGLSRVFHAVFAVLLCALPAGLASKLLVFRVNPSSLRWARMRMKSLMVTPRS